MFYDKSCIITVLQHSCLSLSLFSGAKSKIYVAKLVAYLLSAKLEAYRRERSSSKKREGRPLSVVSQSKMRWEIQILPEESHVKYEDLPYKRHLGLIIYAIKVKKEISILFF